jgi:hypothetical protein
LTQDRQVAEEGTVTDVVDAPSEQSIRAAFAEAEKEAAFWREHRQEFVARYPDQFVAVARTDWQVVAASPSLEAVIGLAEKQGHRIGSVWIELIAATPLHVSL